MRVWMDIDPGAAVRAGRAQSGVLSLDMTEDQVQALPAEEREVLASLYGLGRQDAPDLPSPRYGDGRPALSAPALEELRRLLQWRAAAPARAAAEEARQAEERRQALEARQAEERRQAEEWSARPLEERISDGGWGAKRCTRRAAGCSDEALVRYMPASVAEADAECDRRNILHEEGERRRREEAAAAQAAAEAGELAFRAALSAWVEEHGTQSQRARHAMGVLPDDEVLSSVRDALFGAVPQCRARYRRLTASDLDHSDGCGEYSQAEVSFSVYVCPEMTPEQYEVWRTIRDVLPEQYEMVYRRHVGTCDSGECSGYTERWSALVTTEWHGRRISREYALPDA